MPTRRVAVPDEEGTPNIWVMPKDWKWPRDARGYRVGIEALVADKPLWASLTGAHNDLPPNWSPGTEREFWHRFQMYTPIREFRQPTVKFPGRQVDWGFYGSVNLFWYHDGTGLGLRQGKTYEDGYKPTFFKFALCIHERISTLDTQYGDHQGHCGKCGLPMNYDSSG